MESIEQIEQLIAQTESQTTHLDEKIINEATEAGLVETDIEHLRAEVEKVELPEVRGDGDQLAKDILSTNEVLTTLAEEIRLAKTVEQRRKKQGFAEIEILKAQKAQLQAHLDEKHEIDRSKEVQASELLSAAQKQLTHQQEQIQVLLADLQKDNLELSALQIEIDALHSQQKNSVHQTEETVLKWKAQEARLLQELNKLQRQAKDIENSVKTSTAAHEAEKQTVLKEVSQQKAELATEKQLSKRLSTFKHTTEAQIKQLEQAAAFEQAKIEEFEKIIVELQVQAKKLQLQVANLKKANREIVESIKFQEKRQKQEQAKSKIPKKSTKDLIIKQEKEFQKLTKDLEREKVRLENQTKLKSTYISTDNLSILQREYERHRQPNGPSLEVKTAQKDKLVKDNKALIDSIANLKRLIKESEDKQSKILAESKKKGDTLTAGKLAIEKQINSISSKLNEYLKEFPNHLANKTKKVKQEQTIIVPKDRTPYVAKNKRKVDKEQEEIDSLIRQINENKANMEPQNEIPIYKTLYFQAGALLVGLLVVVMIS